MGKKPVVVMLGLWAGIALTGCGKCCQNCHNKYNAQPSFTKASTTPTAAPVTPPMMAENQVPQATENRVPDPAGNTGYATPGIQTTGGMNTSNMPSSVPTSSINSPVSQNSLRSQVLDETPMPTSATLPARMDDGLSATQPVSSSGEALRRQIPPTPVIPKSTIAESSAPLPPQSSSLPLPPQGSTMPLPPQGSTMPLPPQGGAPLPPPSAELPSASVPSASTSVPEQVPPISGQPLPSITTGGSTLPPPPSAPAPLPPVGGSSGDAGANPGTPSAPPYLK